jgi:acetyltransferase-like isoleucine patch superfamily enzyme
LPLPLAVGLVRRRVVDLVRGLLRLWAPVFLGPRVRIRGRRGLSLGRWSSIGGYSDIDGYSLEGVRLGPASRLGSHCVVTVTSHVGRLGRGFTLGARSGLDDYCHVGASGGVHIGDDVITGPFVSFHAQEHVFTDPDQPVRSQGVTEAGIRIGDGSWIGARVTVLDGTVVGANSVIAAGAVVKGTFPPHSLLAGIPARVIRDLSAGPG